MDLDATLVTSHSDKEQAVGTYKGGYGFAPFIASVDYGAGNECKRAALHIWALSLTLGEGSLCPVTRFAMERN